MSEPSLYQALSALRDAGDPFARHLDREWRVVWATLQSFVASVGPGTAADREDAVGESWLKVRRGVANLSATNEASARKWLRRIYKNALRDLGRKRHRLAELFESSAGEGLGGPIARTASEDPSPEELATAPVLDADRLTALRELLFQRVDEHLEAHVRAHARPNARQRAELAYENLVRERPTEELLAAFPRVKKNTFYQWVHRGREQVLIPVLERWVGDTAEATDPDLGQQARYAVEVLVLLRGKVRSDAGQPRPKRRRRTTPPEG